jgi:hypothetical protein
MVIETSRAAEAASPGGADPPCDMGRARASLEAEKELQRLNQDGGQSIGGKKQDRKTQLTREHAPGEVGSLDRFESDGERFSHHGTTL